MDYIKRTWIMTVSMMLLVTLLMYFDEYLATITGIFMFTITSGYQVWIKK